MYVITPYRGYNFYPIASKTFTQVGLVKIFRKFQDGLCIEVEWPSSEIL